MPFADGPTTAELEEQLELSCALILNSVGQGDIIFDRCPLDLVAYLDVVSGTEGFEWEPHARLLTGMEKAMRTIGLVVFVPLTRPDEIAVAIEYPKLRRRVDARVRALLSDDELGLLEGVRVLTVSGPREQRVAMVLAEMEN